MTMTTKNDKRARKTSQAADKAEIRVRIDAKTKSKAERYFKRYGMTTGAGVRLLLDRMLKEKEPLFDPDAPHVPNAVTRKAIEDAEVGKLTRVTVDDLQKIWDDA